MAFKRTVLFCLLCLVFFTVKADNAALSVWANEAIVATYTFGHKNFIERQKEIAKYFTPQGWTAYSKAFLESKLPEAVQKNQYQVASVALMPPEVEEIDSRRWRATMPLLVVYKNPQYQQKQTLEIVIDFTTVPAGQGVRGLAITSLRSKVIKPPCRCAELKEEKNSQSP
ncbi:DotI/IcmL family type IV secretion protein [Legionella londiniensis]|uniref:IcmL-like protein n=1 Tax=Legionella londiniensis TaxID=45068 RepID=A0A0W0VJ79_9GAMM|nr:DotI/IcmL family type IV secretion protein [Legionella londiniensis]KTD20170.1 hypothetical protein Llon_1791 [Legionella londiniensis]STX94337.1 IcmL/DotI homolog [Legionella londiniensis]